MCHFNGMKSSDTASNGQSSVRRQFHEPIFAKVVDGRKQPIRGLWVRNGRYYGRLAIEDVNTGRKKTQRVPLMVDGEPAATMAQAVAALNRLKTQRADDDLPTLNRTPKFSPYADGYL